MVKLLTKPQWIIRSGAKLCKFSLHKEALGNIKTEVLHERDFNYVTRLTGEKGENLGKDHFYMNSAEHLMVDYDVTIKNIYRGKHRLGELLRLVSVMQMLENNIQKMELYSKESAVLFHAKYGFKPDIRQFLHRDKVLEQISKDKRFEDLSKKADFILNKIDECTNVSVLRELCKVASKLAEEYMQNLTYFSDSDNNAFNHGFDMKLEKDFILRNKAKFNEMFKNQGLDYKI